MGYLITGPPVPTPHPAACALSIDALGARVLTPAVQVTAAMMRMRRGVSTDRTPWLDTEDRALPRVRQMLIFSAPCRPPDEANPPINEVSRSERRAVSSG